MEDVAKTIRALLVEKLGIVYTQITPEANFIKDLGVDSLDHAELVMEMEQKFDIKIPDEDAEKLITIQDVIDYVSSKISNAGQAVGI